jgi:hypothetical protein
MWQCLPSRVTHTTCNRHVAHGDNTYRHVPSLSPCLNAALLAECTWTRPRLPRLHSFIKEMPSWYRNPTVRPHTSHCALRTVKRSKSAPVQWDCLAVYLCCITKHPSLAVQVGSAWMSQTLSTSPPLTSRKYSHTLHHICPIRPKTQETVQFVYRLFDTFNKSVNTMFLNRVNALLWVQISGGWGFPTATLLEARAY